MTNLPEAGAAGAKEVRLSRAPNGSLVLFVGNASFPGVQLVRAAPLSQRDRYICFLDTDGEEICMVRDLSELAQQDRHVAEEELRMRYIITEIRGVISIRRESGTLYCKTGTNRGSKELILRSSDENVRWLNDRHLILTDVYGSRFEVPDIQALDRESARMLKQNLR
jgi:hypothetical protein